MAGPDVPGLAAAMEPLSDPSGDVPLGPRPRLQRRVPGRRVARTPRGARRQPAPGQGRGHRRGRLLDRRHAAGAGGLRRRARLVEADAGGSSGTSATAARARPSAPRCGGHLRADGHPRRRSRIPPARPAAAGPRVRRGRGRRRLRLALRGRRRAPGAVLPARAREQVPDVPLQPGDQPEPDRHGDVLQGRPHRSPEVDPDRVERLPARAGADDQAGQAPGPHPRSADQLFRPELPGRQEDRLAGRPEGAGRRSRASAFPTRSTSRTPTAAASSHAWPGRRSSTRGSPTSSVPYCGTRVLEIGAGVGNLTLRLVPRADLRGLRRQPAAPAPRWRRCAPTGRTCTSPIATSAIGRRSPPARAATTRSCAST